MYSVPVVSPDNSYVYFILSHLAGSDETAHLYCLSTTIGAVQWQIPLGVAVSLSDPLTSHTGDRLFVAQQSLFGTYALSFDAKDGTLMWNTTIKANSDMSITSTPVLSSDSRRLYVGYAAFPGKLFSINTAVGTIQQQWSDLPVTNGVLSSDDKTFYAGSLGKGLYALVATDPFLSTTTTTTTSPLGPQQFPIYGIVLIAVGSGLILAGAIAAAVVVLMRRSRQGGLTQALLSNTKG
mgnify:CR=1 FL=1